MSLRIALSAAALLMVQSSANAAETIRVGLMSTMSGPISILGREVEMGFDLALKQLGMKLGGVPVVVAKDDARMTPDTALQAVTKMIERDKIDFLLGVQLSNQLLAIAKPVIDSGAFIISSVGGPSEFAGAGCLPNFFVVSWQNDTPSEAVGKHMTDAGIKRMFAVAQNYITGREHVAGAKHYFKGEVVGEAYPDRTQMDFAAELAQIRAARPDGVFIFAPGAQSISFVKQFTAAGLHRSIRLFSGSWIADEHSFGALGDTALGIEVAANWFVGLDDPQNRQFVAAFRKEYGRVPVLLAALTYDAVMLVDSAVRQVGGKIENKDALRAALRKADFKSVRGKFRFDSNQFPVQDFFIAKVVKKDGVLQHEVMTTAFADHRDRYHRNCPMKF